MAATVLHFLRVHVKGRSETWEWGNDMFGIGTVLLISVLLAGPIAKTFTLVPPAWTAAFVQTSKANGILTLTALANCIRTIGSGIYKSVQKA